MNMANMAESNMSEANLGEALARVEPESGEPSGADLRRATLGNAILGGANFENAIVGFTVFGGVDLSSCRGLDLVFHLGPSTLGVDSIIYSQGRIPEIFLRGVGLPDEWIDFIQSLVGDGIQFFSCFISYSSLDRPFAKRLYDALQSKGIRCWLDEKQLLPGHDISRELSEAFTCGTNSCSVPRKIRLRVGG